MLDYPVGVAEVLHQRLVICYSGKQDSLFRVGISHVPFLEDRDDGIISYCCKEYMARLAVGTLSGACARAVILEPEIFRPHALLIVFHEIRTFGDNEDICLFQSFGQVSQPSCRQQMVF